MARISLETIGVIAASEALPNVMKGKSFALAELLNVTVFVKQELWMKPCALCEKYRPAKRDRSDGRLAEKPAAYSQRQATAPVPQLFELGPVKGQLVREANRFTEESVFYLRDISQVSPPA